MSARPNATSVAPFLRIAILLSVAVPVEVSAQFQVGLGLGVADTDQNAIALGSTINWEVASWLTLRGYGDGELAVPDLKAGLRYDTDPVWIVDANGTRQRPSGDDLWQARGWHAHAALYATTPLGWRTHMGAGLAYNGFDASFGPAFVVAAYVTRKTEIDVELLDPGSAPGGRWRLRLALDFWNF